MGSGEVIRGTRVGASSSNEGERGPVAPRTQVDYWCASGHRTVAAFAAEAEVPQEWDCSTCGLPAGRDPQDPPPPSRHEPYKTHLAYVKERRSAEDGAALLEEALDKLRRRGA